MKMWTKALLGALGIGAVVAVAGGYGGNRPTGKVVDEGMYDNKGQTAYWKINGVLAAWIKFPDNDWANLASQGGQEQLMLIIDSRMKENGYLPVEESSFQQGNTGRYGS